MSTPHRTSYSGLEEFRRSPALYYGRRIAQTIPRRKETDALRFGRAFDLALFEPAKFEAEVALAPAIDRVSKIGRAAHALAKGDEVHVCEAKPNTKAYRDFKSALPPDALLVNQDEHDKAMSAAEVLRSTRGKILLSEDEAGRIAGMVKSARRHPIAAAMLELRGQAQFELEWTDERTGIVVRGRVDRITDVCVLDGKTVGAKAGSSYPDLSPEAWGRACAAYGYHRQEAIYREGLRAVGLDERPFAFLVVGSVEPFDVAVHELKPSAVAVGTKQFRRTIDRLAECLRTDVWSAEYQAGVNQVSLPVWAEREL